MVEKQVDEVMKVLLPKVQEAVKSAVDGTLVDKIPQLKSTIENELWDKMVELIGKQLNLPKELIGKLQTIDDLVKNNESTINKAIEDMALKYETFKDRIKGVDLNETVTMSYGQLQKEKAIAAKTWATLSFLLGLFSGVSILLFLYGKLFN